MNKKRVLCFGRKMHGSGGVQRYIYSLFSNINKEKIQMDFLIPDMSIKEQPYLSKFEEKGSKVFLIQSHKESLIKHIISVYKISKLYKNNGIIHIHVSSGIHSINGTIARLAGIKNVIYHSHNASFNKNISNKISKIIFKLSGTHFLACTEDAGRYMFGESILNSNKFMVAKNGIDTNTFKFNKNKRQKIRNEFNIPETTKVLGFVGRLSSEKNVNFVIEVFNELLKFDSNIFLMLTGDGEEEKVLKELIYKYNIQDKVIMTGVRNDVDYIMSALDVFLLPSEYEALGIVLIEAQTSGLPCYVSKNVSRYAKVTDQIYYLELSSKQWAEKIHFKELNRERSKYYKEVNDAGYDLKMTSKKMQEFYININ